MSLGIFLALLWTGIGFFLASAHKETSIGFDESSPEESAARYEAELKALTERLKPVRPYLYTKRGKSPTTNT
jgi:hypothetical protein